HAALDAIGATLDVFGGDRHNRAGKNAFCAGADGMFVRWTEIDGAFLDAAHSVRAIVRYGVGYDNIDIDAASARGVPVCNVQGYANHSVSDHALALMLACVRGLRIGIAPAFLRAQYASPPRPRLPELRNMTLGIIGLGRIGGTLCAKARGLFQRVLACDPYIPYERFERLGAIQCDFDALLRESDIVSVHCNLTDETRRLIGRDALARMKPSAIVINTSRGPVVDEDALLDALQDERLYAAGLDCFWDEPPLANRDALLAHPHLVATGHYAWFSTEASRELQRRAAENMVAMLRGEIPEDCLNQAYGTVDNPNR
ncbi:MAG: C-terminal binding protein, partial [Candidatus Hydrogenedentes bacterium]|nr:C-terminal binding protein [Candidatus Hydrogenedentota bacterium]